MNPSSPSPDQESQITAYLLGELSQAERAAVESSLAENAELSELFKRLEKTIGFIRETSPLGNAESDLEPDSLQFSSERRAKLLQILSIPNSNQEPKVSGHRIPWYLPLGIAALLMISLSYLSLTSRLSPDAASFETAELSRSLSEGEANEKLAIIDGLSRDKLWGDTLLYSAIEPDTVKVLEDPTATEGEAKQGNRSQDNKKTLDQRTLQLARRSFGRGFKAEGLGEPASPSEMSQPASQVALGYAFVPAKEEARIQSLSESQFELPAIVSAPAPETAPTEAFVNVPSSQSLATVVERSDSYSVRQSGVEQGLAESLVEQQRVEAPQSRRQIAAVEENWGVPSVDPFTGLPSNSSTTYFSRVPEDLSRGSEIARFGDSNDLNKPGDPLSESGGYAAGGGGGIGGGAGGGMGGAIASGTIDRNRERYAGRRLNESRREGEDGRSDGFGSTLIAPLQDQERHFYDDVVALEDDTDAGITAENSVRLNVAQQEASKDLGRSAASMANGANGVVAGESLRRIELQTATHTKDALGLIDTEALKQDHAVPSPSPTAKPAPVELAGRRKSALQLEERSIPNYSQAESDSRSKAIEADLDIAFDSTVVEFDETPAPIRERNVKRVARKQITVAGKRPSNRQVADISDFAVPSKRPNLKLMQAKAVPDNAVEKLEAVTKLAQQIANEEAESIEPPIGQFPLEKQTAEAPVSTFSLNVSDVSFRLAAASLNQNVLPAPESIRPEEFFNALPYHDPNKHAASPIRVHTERARFKYGHRQELLRIGVKTRSSGRHSDTPLNLVLLIDNSGSMERPDRQLIVRRSLESLLSTLSERDQVSLIAFARQPRLWAEGLAPSAALSVLDNLANTSPEGGTNLENALTLAYATAKKHYQAAGQNRVILFTDGAANLGNTSTQSLSARVETHRQQGIALDCFGIGFDGYDDHRLEALTRNGDGRYAFLNNLEQVENDFIRQLTGALNVAAKNVKVQITFNPLRVTSYRQIGYAKHQLKKEQFRDNRVDAAELAAEESGTALYVLTMNPDGSGPVGDLNIRYQSPETGQFQELNWSLPYPGPAKELEDTSQGTQLATAAALFAERLAGSPYSRDIPLRDLETIVTRATGSQSLDPSISQLKTMILQAESLSGF